MFLYVGNYWVPFPSSEYGGTWVVMAENNEQCIELLESLGTSWYQEFNELIPDAVAKAQVFQLDENALTNRTPRIIDSFLT